jgi:hypothetical protein
MSDLEDRIRAALNDPRRQIPVWPDPMPRVRRVARRQRLKLAVTSAIVAVVAVVGVAALVKNLPVAGNGSPSLGGALSPKVTRSATSGVKGLPEVGAPGYPVVIYPPAVRPRPGGAGAVTACPAPVGLVTPPSSARATVAALIDLWETGDRAAALHAADRAIWPVINVRTYRAPQQPHTAEPVLYAGLLKAVHRNFGVPNPAGWISSSCGAATADWSYLVVTGSQSAPALQGAWVFVDRAGHLLLYFRY